MIVELVIARYGESLEWVANLEMHLRKLGYDTQVYVYNKGADVPSTLPEWLVESLPNVGRESHTHLHHITKYYSQHKQIRNNAYVVFLQGSIDDHMRMWHSHYTNMNVLISDFINDARQHGGASMKWAKKHEKLGGNTAHWNFRINQHNGKVVQPRADCCFGEWFTRFVDAEAFANKQDLLHWWVAGLFCVSWEQLVSARELEYYQNLMNQLVDLDPEVGHYFERSWVYITGAAKMLPSGHKYDKSKDGRLL